MDKVNDSLLVNSSHTFTIQLLSIIGSIFLLFLILNLVKKGYLKETYSIIWIITASIVFLVSIFSDLMSSLAKFTGVYYAPTTVIIILIFGLILISIHFSVLITKHEEQIKKIVQENGLLKSEIEEIKLKKK